LYTSFNSLMSRRPSLSNKRMSTHNPNLQRQETGKVSLLRLPSQLLLVFLNDSVGLLGGQKSNIVDLRPAPLRTSQQWSCARNNVPQSKCSDARHDMLQLPRQLREK
jgi:hypothetical protein